jgi:hypothetical protein
VLDGLFVTYDFRTVRGDFGCNVVSARRERHTCCNWQ